MPAPDHATLLNFSANFRAAAVAASPGAGIAHAYANMDPANKVTPRVGWHFVLGEATGHKTPLPGVSGKNTPYDAYWAALTANVVTNNDTNGGEHDGLCAAVRTMMLLFGDTFNPSVLPWYEVNGARPMQNTEGIIAKDNLNVTQLPFRLHFSVRFDAWPPFT